MPKRKRYTQKEMIKKLKDHGWEKSVGGKHQVKMVRKGSRPVAIPDLEGKRCLSASPRRSLSKPESRTTLRMAMMELEVIVHHDSEAGGFWAEVVQMPGCFAAGHTRQELEESLKEAIALYLDGADAAELLTSDHVEGIERYRFSEAEGLVPA